MATTEDQYITSSSSISPDVNSMTACGSRSHPWRLEAPAGQRINISLFDFSASVRTPRDGGSADRRQYGYIIEKYNKRNVSIYASTVADGIGPQRESAVYTSDTNSLIIVVNSGTNHANNNFLIKLKGNNSLRPSTKL
jgi:hypothetical protein